MIPCRCFRLAFAMFAMVAHCTASAGDPDPKSAKRVAVLPTISDTGTHSGWRPWTKSFDAALQAELLEGWETIVSSRAGLSTVVFEQRLAIAKGERAEPPQVRAADFLVFVVLDARTSQLLVHVAPVGKDMREAGEPVVHRFNNARDFASIMPGRVAKDVAARMGLKMRVNQAEATPEAASATSALRLAIVPPFSAMEENHPASGMVPVFNAMLEEACLNAGPHIDLVEREEISRLLAERELAASGAATADINAVSAADVARIAGARLILVPYLFPTHQDQARVTVHAIDSTTGQIVAARSWQQPIKQKLPADHIRALLASASQYTPEITRETPTDAALRHAEARFLRTIRHTMNALRADFRERMEIRLLLADAAIALAHDDTPLLSGTLHNFLFSLSWYDRLTLEYNFSTNPTVRHYKRAQDDGTLAEMHNQVRRIFEAPLREIFEQRGMGMDRVRLAHLLTMTGRPQEAAELLIQLPQGIEDLLSSKEHVLRYAEALIEEGRFKEAAEFLKEDDRRHIMSESAFKHLCNAFRANGDYKSEIGLMYRDFRKRLENFEAAHLARFLEIAPLHSRPEWCLLVFNRHAHAWYCNDPEVVVQLVRLKKHLGQTEHAIEDAQCGHLASVIAGDEKHSATFLTLLEELGAKPLDALPLPADHVRFSTGTRIDLFHDITIPEARAQNIASHMARFWACNVHVIATPLDITKLTCFDRLSRRTHGRKLVDSMHPLIREDASLLQTIFLTSLPLEVDGATITSATIRYGPVYLGTTHYTDYFHKPDAKTTQSVRLPDLDEKVAMSLQGGVIRRVLDEHHIEQSNPKSPFRPLPPDPLATSGRLNMNDRLFGVSPTTARLLGEITPGAFLEKARDYRVLLRDHVVADDSPDTRTIREIASRIAENEPVVIKP